MAEIQPFLGLAAIILFAWTISENKRGFSWRLVAAALVVQFALALVLLKLPQSQIVFIWLNDGVVALQKATEAGTSLVFGFLGGGPLPFKEPYPGAAFILAFRALPLVLLMSALSALLYHWRILPWIVRGFAWGLGKALGISGAAGFGTAANVFVGMVEAPLLIRPYLNRISRSELFIVMTAGMATIAGTMYALYVTFLANVIPGAAGHLLTASLISAPAAILIARLIVPSDEAEVIERVETKRLYDNSMDAITTGTIDGLRLLGYILGMLVVLVALVALANAILGLAPDAWGAPLTLQRMLGWVMGPVTWLIGIPWSEAVAAGQLLGTKVVLNELLAYLELAKLPPEALSERSRLIMTYAMCGFAHFGSLGIMIGGLGAMAPDRRGEIVQLGLKSVLAGVMATCMTGAVVAVLL
jgi:concentrative nucleoside transporter, CNT family